jgi:diguanylate cyclase (GGDEF)-like protein
LFYGTLFFYRRAYRYLDASLLPQGGGQIKGGSVESIQLPDHQKEILLGMLAEPDPDRSDWIRRLRRVGRDEGFDSCAATIRFLVNLVRNEDEAEELLVRIMDHRAEISSALGRDPGIQVSSVDYLSNVETLLLNPKVVELSQFERTMMSASTDPLTGLYNRRYFSRALRREIARCRRHRLHFSLLLMDLDHFKQLNDEHGHLVGDEVLKKVAECLRSMIRDVDVACRYGGEEFAILLPETERLGAYIVADRLRERIAGDFTNHPTGGKHTPVTISGGLAVFPTDGREISLLLERADEGLYEAKREGRNRITLYHQERRYAIRYPYRGLAPIYLEQGPRSEKISVRGVDISSNGLLVETGQDVAQNSRVKLTLEGAMTAQGPWELNGRIVRVVGNGDEYRRLGIALEKPVPEACLVHHVLSKRSRRGVDGSSR